MLDLLDEELARSGGPFLLGEKFTAVDPYLFMLTRWTRMHKNPARNRPHLGRYQQMMLARPAVQRTFEAEGLGEPYV
jgi:glutathione S-transferase